MAQGHQLITDMKECVLQKGQGAFWWLGQLGYGIKLGNATLYIDGYFKEEESRLIPPLLKDYEVVNADIVLGTHDHSDHIDRSAWYEIYTHSKEVLFVVPNVLIEGLSKDLGIPKERFIGLDHLVSKTIKGVTITGVASAHEFLTQDEITGEHYYLGYVIEGNGVKLYHSGDTCIYPALYDTLESFGRFDVMYLPINGRDGNRYRNNIIGNMTYQEAVDLAGVLNPKIVVPGHYDMFAANSEDPQLFVEYLNAKYPQTAYCIPNHGEKTII